MPAPAPTAGLRTGGASVDEPGEGKRHRRDGEATAGRAAGGVHMRVEAILRNDAISELEASEALLGIASDPDADSAERQEALEHGLLLAPADRLPDSLLALAGDLELPLPMARSVVDHFYDLSGDLQIRGCLAMTSHSSSTVRGDVAGLLAFALEAEDHEDDLEFLVRMARERLEPQAQAPSDSPPE